MESLVDRSARNTAAQLLRKFVAGHISNDTFEDAEPTTHDLAVHAIWQTAWVFYDDFKEHHLVGKHRLSPDQRRMCVRWLLFLHSDFPYEWPIITMPGIDPASRIQKHFFERLFSSHQDLSEETATAFLSAGHYPVWPFIRVADYKQSLSHPKLLSSSKTSNLS